MSASRLLFATVTLLFFLGFSMQTQGQDTPTPEPPTLVPSETPIPPSDTPIPPSNTPVPPTNTDTPLPPTNTDTPVPPTETAAPESTEALPTLPTATSENTPDVLVSSSTPLASETPVQTVAITPELAPSVTWSVVFSDSFETPNLVAWLFTDIGWGYASPPDGTTALRVFNTAAPVYYQPSDYAHVAVEVSVNVAAGNAHVYARQSAAGSYEAQLTTAGDVLLNRSGVLVATSHLTNFSALQPHRVRLNVYENYLAVEVDGQTQLSVVDPTPLPPGRIGFAASFPALPDGVMPVPPQNTVVFDNVVVYQPAGQVVPTALPPSATPLMLPSATPAYPPIQLPPLPEAARFSTFALDEPINIPNGDVAALIAAMSAGGSSTIHLAENGEYVLTEASADLFAPTGLPIIGIGSELTIYGHHAVIRAANSGFRLFGVDQGILTLSDLTLRDATLFTNGGAAVSNNGGIVTLTNVRLENNRVEVDTTYGRGTGGAVYTYFGRTTIHDSFFVNNYAVKYGGALYNWDGVVTLTNTRFEGNQAGLYGGALGSRDERSGGGITGEGNTYLNNSAGQAGGAFYIESGTFSERNSVIANNSAGVQASVLFSGVTDDPVGASLPVIQVTRCDITGNTPPLIVAQLSGGTVNFERNWWGTPTGPTPSDVIGSTVTTAHPVITAVVQCTSSALDLDGDCLPDAYEATIPGLSSTSSDSDGNGIPDKNEDYDADGLTNLDEYLLGTQPTNPDSDGDGITDGAEVYIFNTNPNSPDTDGDGLTDGFEVNASATSPTLIDTDGNDIADGDEDFDGDGLTNIQEQRIGTAPLNPDSDGNGIADGDEDFDGDGLTNIQELTFLDPQGVPRYDFTRADSDGNGIGDGDEDPDSDGLPNRAEFASAADPLNPDTDGDRLPDGFEVYRSLTNPTLTDTDGINGTDDLEDPDGDGLNNYQEYRLGTDPHTFTTLGAPSRLRSETVLMPVRATADGVATITMTTIVRDSQGRFLPGRAVTWSSTNPNLALSAATGVTDEDGVATIQITSSAVTSGVVEIRALNIVVGRPVVQFIGGDPAVRFTAYSAPGVLPGQVMNATFEVVNEGVRPISGIEVVATLPLGAGVFEVAIGETDVELRGQGSNSVTWNIPRLEIGERRQFSLRFRVGSTLGIGAQIPLTVQTSAIEDINTANNSASLAAYIVPSLPLPGADQQADRLSVSVTSAVPVAAVGETIQLVVTVENLSSEPLFNLSGFAPLLGSNYPNVAFQWGTPGQPGYLAPAGSGSASQATATVPYTIPVGYPAGLNRTIVVQAIDDNPVDGSSVVGRDSLTDAELGIRGPNLTASLTADRASAVDGEVVTFTLTVTNSTAATDSATNLQVVGSFIAGVQPLAPLAPGASTTFQFTRLVTLADAPQISAQVLLTGQGATETDVLINQSLRRTVGVVGLNIAPNTSNLSFEGVPALVFLPGRTTALPLTIRNAGTLSAEDVRLRVTVPFGVDVDMASLSGASFDAQTRVLTWALGGMNANTTRSVTPAFLTPVNATLGSQLILDAQVSTTSSETTLDDNLISPSGMVALPAPSRVVVTPFSRNWLVADNRDRITVQIAVYDQLGAPLPDVTPVMTAGLPGIIFGAVAPTNAQGITTVSLQASGAGTVNIIATFANGTSGATTLNRRDSAVSITHNPTSIGIGGSDRYSLFVVNTATLPDGTTSTGDLVDLTFTLPPELPAEWFQFAQQTLPLGFGDFTETRFTVTIPPASALPDCQALVGTYPFTVTATGRSLGIVGQAQGQLTISAEPPQLTNIVPANNGRIGGDRVLFSWRSNTPGDSIVYYRRQGEPAYQALPLTADTLDPRLYSAALDITGEAEGTIFEWYGEIANGCSTRSIASAAGPQTFTRVRSTTFTDTGYDFTVADGYDLTTTTSGSPLMVRVRNDDDVSHAILLDVDNPYDDLILGFIDSGSVDQVVMLAPGQTFATPLRVFTQETEREVYSLSLRLENDEGDIDRIPLVIRVQQPRVELDIQILEVDTSTLVTRARLTNLGDTLTDLTLDIVQDTTGIPANMIIQPDIQHTYLQAGQSLEVTFIPLDVQNAEAAPANVSMPLFDPLTNTALSSQPSLLALAGPYRVTAHARNTTLPNVTLRDGTLTNTCGADGSDRTIAAECTTPAGTETVIANSWYCTNRPNIDVGITLALPDGGLGVPITDVSVGANFTPGGYGPVYTHSTTLALNGSLVGSAIVPSQPRIEGSVAPETLVLGGSSPAQILNLRSTHTNEGHYTVASGFTVTVDYDAHTRTGCFSQAEIDAANGALMCAVDPSLVIPDESLDMTLTVDPAAQAPQTEDGAFVFTVGEQIPMIAQVSAAGTENIGDTVRVELTVPRGLVPQGMTIAGEDQSLLDQIFSDLTEFLATLGLPFSDDYENGLGVTGDDEHVTFVYDYDRDLVIGQPLPITLDVVGEHVGNFTVVGQASIAPAAQNANTPAPQVFSANAFTSTNSIQPVAQVTLQISADSCRVVIGGELLANRIPIYESVLESDSASGIEVVSLDDYDFIDQLVAANRKFEARLLAQYVILQNSQPTYWYYITFDTSQFKQRQNEVVGQGWISPSHWAIIAEVNENNATPCIEELPETDRDGVTPSVAIPFTSGNLSLVYAPIPGNPVLAFDGIVQGDNATILRITQYANNPRVLSVDPRNPELWIRATVYRENESVSGWVLVNSNLPTNTNPSASISLDESMTSTSIAEIRARLPDQSSVYGDVLDAFVNGNTSEDPGGWLHEPTFNFLPISLDDFCSSTTTQIRGLGVKYSNPDTPNDPNSPGTYGRFGHEGVDFFGIPPTIQSGLISGTAVYSIASTSGLVVGIGREREGDGTSLYLENTASYWGATDIIEDTGYSVIVRYGHLYVLYGHLISIDQSVFVGAPIQPQQRIGILGSEADTHLHLEVRNYDADLNPSQQLSSVGAWLGFVRNYDGVQLPNRPPNAYDATTLFPSAITVWTDDNMVSLAQVTGMDISLYASDDDGRPVTSRLTGVCTNQNVFNYYANSANSPLQTTTYTFPDTSNLITIPGIYFPQPDISELESPNMRPLIPERD